MQKVVDFISELPPELVENVLHILDWKTLGQCCLVSRGWNDVITKSRVWVSLCRREGFVAGPSVLSGRVTRKALFLHLKHRLDNLEQQGELITNSLDYNLEVDELGFAHYPTLLAYSGGLVVGGGKISVD